MAAAAPPRNPNAVEAWEPKTVINADAFPSAQFNRLIPTQTVMQVSPYVKPVVQIVQLDVQRDTYESRDLPNGHRALGRVGLRKLATTAGITFTDERRTDDGKDPDVIGIETWAEMTLPTGQKIRAPGSKLVRLSDQPFASDQQRKRYRQTFQEHVASRAQNRAIRALLSLQQSYPAAELAKPFAVVTFVPDMSHPEVRAAMLNVIAPKAIESAFGPEVKRVGPGVVEVPEAADDAIEGNWTEAPTAPTQDAAEAVAAGRVDPATGELAADDEPDWFGAAAATSKPGLVDRLRALAEESTGDGPASAEQREELKIGLRGVTTETVMRTLKAAFGITNLPAITERQAAAILREGRTNWGQIRQEMTEAAAESAASQSR